MWPPGRLGRSARLAAGFSRSPSLSANQPTAAVTHSSGASIGALRERARAGSLSGAPTDLHPRAKARCSLRADHCLEAGMETVYGIVPAGVRPFYVLVPVVALLAGVIGLLALAGYGSQRARFILYAAGWFRLSNGQRALLYGTTWRRVLYVPTNAGYALLVSPEDPDGMLADLRRRAGPKL